LKSIYLPNTVKLKDNLSGLGTQFVRFDGANEAAALHLAKTNDNLLTLGVRVNNAKLQTSDFDQRLTALSKSLTNLALVSGGTFGSIVKDVAGLIDGVDSQPRRVSICCHRAVRSGS
jgi:hypothetical protein